MNTQKSINSRLQMKVGRALLALSYALFVAAGGVAQADVFYINYNGAAWVADPVASGDYVSVAGRQSTNSDAYAAKSGAGVDLISGGVASSLGLSLNYNSLSAVLDNTGFMWGANTSGGVDYLNYFGGWVSSPLVSGSYLSVSANNSSSGSLYASKSGGGIDYIYYTGGGGTGWAASTLLSTPTVYVDIAPQYGNNGMMWAVTSTGGINRIDYSGGWVETPIIGGNYISVCNSGTNGFAYAARADGGIDYIAYLGGWVASPLFTSSTVYNDLAADLQGNGFMWATATTYGTWAGSYGLDPAVTTGPTAGAPTADPDRDGFNNQSEYAFGTIPITGNGALLTTSVNGSNMVVTWLQRTDAAAGAYKVKTTTNLTTAFTVDATLTAEVGPASDQSGLPTGYERKQVSVPINRERNFLALAFD